MNAWLRTPTAGGLVIRHEQAGKGASQGIESIPLLARAHAVHGSHLVPITTLDAERTKPPPQITRPTPDPPNPTLSPSSSPCSSASPAGDASAAAATGAAWAAGAAGWASGASIPSSARMASRSSSSSLAPPLPAAFQQHQRPGKHEQAQHEHCPLRRGAETYAWSAQRSSWGPKARQLDVTPRCSPPTHVG